MILVAWQNCLSFFAWKPQYLLLRLVEISPNQVLTHAVRAAPRCMSEATCPNFLPRAHARHAGLTTPLVAGPRAARVKGAG